MANKRPHSSISSSDEELLTSGLFSDVTVKCGDRTWDLHRAILTRCPFFQKALEPNRFKESTEKQVEITEQDPPKVNWVIYFIYTGRANRELLALLDDDKTVMETCVTLFRIADFFTFDALCTQAADVLLEHIIKYATSTQIAMREGTVVFGGRAKCVDDDFCDRFFETIRVVYSCGSASFQPLKDALLMFPELTRYRPLREDLFKQKLFSASDFTEFAADVLESMVSNPISITDMAMPHSCNGCSQSVETFSHFSLYGLVLAGRCRTCMPIGNKDVMHELRGDLLGEAKRQKNS